MVGAVFSEVDPFTAARGRFFLIRSEFSTVAPVAAFVRASASVVGTCAVGFLWPVTFFPL